MQRAKKKEVVVVGCLQTKGLGRGGLCAQGVVALEFLSAGLGEQRLGLCPVDGLLVGCEIVGERGYGLARVLVAQSVDLGGARAHDVVRGRDILGRPVSSQWESKKGNKCSVRLLLRHLGLKHLAVILHALDLLDRSLLLHHGSVDVLVGENLGRHD